MARPIREPPILVGKDAGGRADYIAPLQPHTLATFRSWGSSAGAGRIRLAHVNSFFRGSIIQLLLIT